MRIHFIKKCITILLIVCVIFSARTQGVDREKLLVAYTYSFLKEIEWPQNAGIFHLNVITTDQRIKIEFENLAKSRRVNGREIELTFTSSPVVKDNADAVFISSKFNSAFRSIISEQSRNALLFITDGIRDKQSVMINFLPSEDQRMKFEINRANILNRGLGIKAEMLLLGGDEIDVAQLFREAQDSVRRMDERVTALQNKFDSLSQNVDRTKYIISEQEAMIKMQNADIRGKQLIVNKQRSLLDSLQQRSSQSEMEVDSIRAILDNVRNELEWLQTEVVKQKSKVVEGNEILSDQEALLIKQDEEILERKRLLEEVVTVVDNQQTRLLYLYLFLGVLIVFSVLTYRAYRLRKINAKKLMEQKEELSVILQELRETQSQLIQSEKMASLGVLTAGIAHEINNAINFVYSGIHILERKFEEIAPVFSRLKRLKQDDSDLRKKVAKLIAEKEVVGFNEVEHTIATMISSIRIGAERTTEIVKGLRVFSRSEEEELTKVDVHQDIDVALLLLQSRHKDKISIKKKFLKKLPMIDGYQGQLGQAFMNIISNAIDAIETVEKEGEIIIETLLINDRLVVKIKDNGSGMSPEDLEKIFDPFFTRKEVGQGTGLGLSITYGIVEKHNGNIKVSSHLNEGTEFIIDLPLIGKQLTIND